MNGDSALTLQASMSQWLSARAFVEGFCAAHAIAREDMLRLTLVAEELFTNAVEHGHAGGAAAQVRLALDRAGDRVQLLVEDRAPAFDPLERAREAAATVEAEFDARPVGGLGLHLVAELAADLRYAREDGRNRFWITLELRGTADDRAPGGGS